MYGAREVVKPIYLIDEFPDVDGSQCIVVADVAFDGDGEYVAHKAYLGKYVAVNTILAYQEIMLELGKLNGEFMRESTLLKGARLYVCTD